MKKILIIAIIAILATISIQAQTSFTSGEIVAVHIYQGHDGILIRFNNTNDIVTKVEDAQNIAQGTIRRDLVILKSNHPFFKEFYSMLLAAKLNGSTISLGYALDEPTFQGFVPIKHIQLQ